MKRTLGILAVVAVSVSVVCMVSAAEEETQGRYRVYMMDGKTVEGEVTQMEDGSYEIKTKYGIVVVVKKGEVKGMVPLEETAQPRIVISPGERAENRSLLRRQITDEEIEEILVGIEAEIGDVGVDIEDLRAPLPTDWEAVEEMKRLAMGGEREPKVLERPHFVMVYTATDESARKLGARLESVWRWNSKLIKRLDLKAERPEYKLEIYYFDTHEEFINYSFNEGIQLPSGALGYYSHLINRSHFFDLMNWQQLEGRKRRAKDPRTPPRERRRLRNENRAWVEHNNQEVIQHEAGHHIHFNTGVFIPRVRTGGTAPTWLVEGATMQFEVPPAATGRGGAGLGELNDSRLYEFRRHFPYKMQPAELKQFLLDNRVWMNGQYDYPRGWAVFYYLWRQHRDGLGKYIRMINDRPPGEEPSFTEREKEFEDCFGRVDEKWMDDFYEFLEGLTIRPSRLPPPL
ncbi:MAG: DUF1570 domain-containing protein [Phycisphaerae bacterium]|nr:DUF1570 domain-containing protein [Phycisphaerae bacterium]